VRGGRRGESEEKDEESGGVGGELKATEEVEKEDAREGGFDFDLGVIEPFVFGSGLDDDKP